MPLPQPEDFADRIRALEQGLRDLRSSLTNQGGLTTASAGWQIPNQTAPATPASGGHLYANGSEPYWRDSLGSTYSLKTPPFPQGASVVVPGISAPDAPIGYSQSQAQAISDGLATTYNALVALVVSLRGAGLIDT